MCHVAVYRAYGIYTGSNDHARIKKEVTDVIDGHGCQEVEETDEKKEERAGGGKRN